MDTIPIYQVDAFTDGLFGGNPAAVCILERWLPKETLQNIASENNLSETAFLVKNQQGFDLRWFTPSVEVDLCGHATLASAHVLFNHLEHPGSEVIFSSRSGILKAANDGSYISLDFPSDPVEAIDAVPGLLEAFGIKEAETFRGKTDLMLVVKNEDTVHSLSPNFHDLGKLQVRGVIVTAPGDKVDFVSRFFAPASRIDEDPVTGSAHCTMTHTGVHNWEKPT